ncbi:MAG TPA: NAD(+)/NADH kinase [Anaerolineae bacterium]|nr:NAD(+)/NADH kinase [Anaerolineae bacterium]
MSTADSATRNAPPRRVILLHTPLLRASASLADQIAERLAEWRVEAQIGSIEADHVDRQVANADMLIALGGDGMMLHAGCVAAQHNIPVLGVNLGRLGFLAEVQPEEWPAVLARVVAGDYWLERRMMLRATLERDAAPLCSVDVLNEVFVGRGMTGRPVRVEARIDGGLFLNYISDGVIVATPTGSTAYALAAGGPILPPELKNILMVAVAPHLIIDRPVVLDEGTTVDLRVASEQAMLSADGREPILLQYGDRVRVQASPHTCQFVRVQPKSYFYRTLMARMTQNPAAQIETNPNQ